MGNVRFFGRGSTVTRRIAVTTAAALFASVIAAAPASATGSGNSSSTDSDVESRIGAVAQTVPGLAEWLEDSDADIDSGVDVAATSVSYGVDDRSVDITGDVEQGVAMESAGGVGITLGLPTGLEPGAIGADGTVSYHHRLGDSSLLAEPTADGGARIIAILDSPVAPDEYEFTISATDGTEVGLAPSDDGSVAIQHGGGEVIATVLEPWAFDAAGTPVPVEYEVEGDEITLSIHANDDAVYPIIADPHVSWGWVTATIYFSKVETGLICTNGLGALGALALSGFWFPIVAGVGWYLTSVACAARLVNQCLKVKSYGVAWRYSGGYCK